MEMCMLVGKIRMAEWEILTSLRRGRTRVGKRPCW